MKNKLLIAAIIIQAICALTQIGFAILKLTEPPLNGEFNALKNGSTTFFSLVSIVFSALLFMLCIGILKKRKAAWIISILIVLLLPFFSAVSGSGRLIFEVSPGAPLSFTGEILPVLTLLLLCANYKVFIKKEVNASVR